VEKEKKWSEFHKKNVLNFFSGDQVKWLRSYYRAQLAISNQDLPGAYKIFARLDKIKEYGDFEKNHPCIFRQIDLTIRGKTNRDITD
jgi:hypothetical protein